MATFKEALQYAQQNPTSDFAKQLETGIKSGQFVDVAKSEGVDLSPFVQKTPTQSMQSESDGVKGILGVGVGAVKGVGSTIKGLGELGGKLLSPIEKGINKITGMTPEKIAATEQAYGLSKGGDVFTPGSDANMKATELITANSGAEKLGKTVEQVGEFFIPGSKGAQVEKLIATKGSAALPEITNIVSKIPGLAKNASKIAEKLVATGSKSVAQAGEGALVTAAQTGGDERAVKDAAIISSLFPVAGAVAGKGMDIAKGISKDMAPRIVNSLIKPLAKDLSYGKNPGRAIAEEGITASSLEDLVQKIGARKNEIGQEIRDIISSVKDKVINASKSVSPIDEALSNAGKSPQTNQALISRLEALKSDLFNGKKLDKMTVQEIFDLKSQVSDLTKFTGNASDDALVNKSLKRVYGSLKDSINKAAGNLKSKSGKTIEDLNEKYADLSSAEIATKYRDAVAERANLISLPANTIGIGSALIGAIASGGAAVPAILAGASGVALEKVASSPKVKTEFAKWLAKSSPEQKSKLFKAVPALRGVAIKLFVGE